MATKKMIRVLVVRPGEKGVMEEHSNSLAAQQKLVGGYIENVGFGDGLYMVCDEEGKLKDRDPNFLLPGDMVVGTVFFCRVDSEGECASLTEDDAKRLNAVVEHGRALARHIVGKALKADA